jgi:pimeloyl-ACP methyl ester carboxylesterase
MITSARPSIGALRRTVGWILLLLSLVLAPVLAGAVFLGVAAITSALPVLQAAGLVALFGVDFGLGWLALAILGSGRARALATFLAGGLSLMVVAATGLTVFSSNVPPVPAAAPSDVRYWSLDTGSRIAYVQADAVGPARPAPIVFLHGGPGTPGEGIPQAGRALAGDGFDVYAYDQVGAGRSSRLEDVEQYTVDRQVRDLDSIRRQLGVEKLILIGRSWGATLAAEYLAAHPNNVAKVVFTSPAPLWAPVFTNGAAGEPLSRLPQATRDRFDELFVTPRAITMSVLLQINPNAARQLMGDPEADALMRVAALLSAAADVCPGTPSGSAHGNPLGFYVNQLTSKDAEHVADPRPRLAGVTVPALVLRGECDFLVPAVADGYRQTLPEATLVKVSHAGHALAREQPAEYLRLVRTFLLGPLDRTAPQ